MSKNMGLLGRKMGMTRIFTETGIAVPVTVIEAGPCVVLQKKTNAKEGYSAIQVGFGSRSESRLNKAEAGHCKAAGKGGFYHVKEFRVTDPEAYEVGQEINITDLLSIGDLVDVRARNKGRGFQGVVRRHGFKGGRATHGSNFHRAPGSIGCSAWPGRVIKGKKMPGQMGDKFITKKNCTVIDIRPEQNVIVLKGGVPGAKQGVVQIYKNA
ncbi:MAG TPA: 50S ribosomal protein L3 [Desulfurivibrio alkaliphilus]|uniref:Large ribosomal subunit protein uL3 n=1 Tax=Desulfurivibrio alkaliphilus TaxID=427923 RepID=A0A7C2TL46_9BACT|nr:50S ribosomal protein L3 [Desulfurivibrio alkaliphilus]